MASRAGLRLYEAMVAAMIGEQRYKMTSEELERLIIRRKLYKRRSGGNPDSAQVWRQAMRSSHLFYLGWHAGGPVIVLRRFGDAD